MAEALTQANAKALMCADELDAYFQPNVWFTRSYEQRLLNQVAQLAVWVRNLTVEVERQHDEIADLRAELKRHARHYQASGPAGG